MEQETKHTIWSLIAHIIVLILITVLEKVYEFDHIKTASILLFISLFLTFFVVNFKRIVAHLKQFYVAKIRGYWEGRMLNDQIRKYFNSAEKIKIKVTRGSIFTDETNAFYECIMKKNNHTSTTNEIQILLHYPCQNSSHIGTRAKAHDLDEVKYLAKLYEIVFNLLKAKNEFNLNLKIRLYGDQQIKWRYYVFKDDKGRKVLFLGYYNDHRRGNLTPMLKVRGSIKDDPQTHTLCDDFESAFDFTFTERSFDIEEMFNSDLSARKECLECLRDNSKCEECHENFKTKIQYIISTFSLTK